MTSQAPASKKGTVRFKPIKKETVSSMYNNYYYYTVELAETLLEEACQQM